MTTLKNMSLLRLGSSLILLFSPIGYQVSSLKFGHHARPGGQCSSQRLITLQINHGLAGCGSDFLSLLDCKVSEAQSRGNHSERFIEELGRDLWILAEDKLMWSEPVILNHCILHMSLCHQLFPVFLVLGCVFLYQLGEDMCEPPTVTFSSPQLPVCFCCYGFALYTQLVQVLLHRFS